MNVELDNVTIRVNLIYKPHNKRIYFRVKDDTLVVTSFKKFSEYELTKLLYENKKSILSLYNKVANITPHTIHYFGMEYEMVISKALMNRISFNDYQILIEAKSLDDSYIKALLKRFYTVKVEEYVEKNFDRIFLSFNDLHIPRPHLTYKYANTFYGKCYPRRNMIEFSGISCKLNPMYIDVIIFHELCHMKYLGHQKDFYDYFESKLKNAKNYQKQLKSLKYNDYC